MHRYVAIGTEVFFLRSSVLDKGLRVVLFFMIGVFGEFHLFVFFASRNSAGQVPKK